MSLPLSSPQLSLCVLTILQMRYVLFVLYIMFYSTTVITIAVCRSRTCMISLLCSYFIIFVGVIAVNMIHLTIS